MIHWAHDFRKISQTHSLAGIGNASKFSTAIEATRQRNRTRKLSLEESASLSKSTNPGKLKCHKDCIACYRALKKYLSTILGKDRFPLRYVIRESEAPYYTID